MYLLSLWWKWRDARRQVLYEYINYASCVAVAAIFSLICMGFDVSLNVFLCKEMRFVFFVEAV